MVRLINDNNIDFLATCVYKSMRLQEFFTHIVEINNKEIKPCIYVMWHAEQFLIHGIKDKAHLNVLISNSIDGEVIARAVEKWGFKVVRGSSGKKGAIASTMQMIERLNEGECVAIMVDGPSGPLRKVKPGAIKIAKKTGAPIVPVVWYSPQWNFVNLPSWDKMTTPLGDCNIINLYGEPIYVPEDFPEDRMQEIKDKIKNSLEDLEKRIPEVHEEARKNKLWSKKK